MILQYSHNNKEIAYIQSDKIIHQRIWLGDILIKYAHKDQPKEDSVDILLDGEDFWVKKNDFNNIIEEENDIINEIFGSSKWSCDSGDMFLASIVGLITLQDWNQEPKYMVVSRACYILNNQRKTIASVI